MPKSPEERQAAALEELARTMKSFVRVQTVINENIVELTGFIKNRQAEIDASVYEKAVAAMHEYEKSAAVTDEENEGGDTNAAE